VLESKNIKCNSESYVENRSLKFILHDEIEEFVKIWSLKIDIEISWKLYVLESIDIMPKHRLSSFFIFDQQKWKVT